MEFKPGRYVSFVAFVGGDSARRDWMAVVWRDPGQPWSGSYRFRYYADGQGNPWDDRDKKSWFDVSFAPDTTEESIGRGFRTIATGLVHHGFNDTFDWVDIRSDSPDKALALLSERPWAHVKHVEAPS